MSQSPAEQDTRRPLNNPRLRKPINFDREVHFRPNLDGAHGRQKSKRALRSWSANVTSSRPILRDSGYETQVQRHNDLTQLRTNDRYPGLILQPDSCPISQDQLAAEVKGIYAGLVMVEAKCIHVDAAQAADPDSHLDPDQWQAMIALHRTLLYEHHDFLMATQHPIASGALRGLAAKYSMPARMWKHGIHAFLDVLRHRRPGPDSQDYMLAFIHMAYQMMALLHETVPVFTDAWIECLGELARYRMAIEQDSIESHATWGSVAARWYVIASDRHPTVGRLHHHLAILDRPNPRKLCLYVKTLTCVIPFASVRNSLVTLCGSIIQDEDGIQSSIQCLEIRLATFRALLREAIPAEDTSVTDALIPICWRGADMQGVATGFLLTNTPALFEFGSQTNVLWSTLAQYLNQLQSTPTNAMIQARNGSVKTREHRPLAEDCLIRGIMGGMNYCPTGMFADSRLRSRAGRFLQFAKMAFAVKRDRHVPSSHNSRDSHVVTCHDPRLPLDCAHVREWLGRLRQRLERRGRAFLHCWASATVLQSLGKALASTDETVHPKPVENVGGPSATDVVLIALPFVILVGGFCHAIWASRAAHVHLTPRSGYFSMLSLVLSIDSYVMMIYHPDHVEWVYITLSLWLATWTNYLLPKCRQVGNVTTFLWAILVATIAGSLLFATIISGHDSGDTGNVVQFFVTQAIRTSPMCATLSSLVFAQFLQTQQRRPRRNSDSEGR